MYNESGFEIIDHPSDTGIRVAARTVERLFELAASGMFSLMTAIENIKPFVSKNLRIVREPGLKIEDLFIIWLEELLYIYEVQELLLSEFKVFRVKAGDYGYNRDGEPESKNSSRHSCVEAKISGEKIDLRRHDILVSIKAPTYHMLEVVKDSNSGLWKGQVIFDV